MYDAGVEPLPEVGVYEVDTRILDLYVQRTWWRVRSV